MYTMYQIRESGTLTAITYHVAMKIYRLPTHFHTCERHQLRLKNPHSLDFLSGTSSISFNT
jgi:hypothetical protein